MKPDEIAEELISYETVSPVEDQRPLEFIQGLLTKAGIDSQIVDIDGVKNLTAGFGTEKVCFNGHIDVVKPGEGWSSDPFNPVRKNGRIYGRGATDMKSELAAQISAFMDLHSKGFEGASLMVVGDEEKGGLRGTKPLVERKLQEGEEPDFAIVGEPTDMNVQVGMRGIAWIDVILHGDEYHAARPEAGESAVEHLPEVLERLKKLEISRDNGSKLPPPTAEITETRFKASGVYNSAPSEIKIGMDVRYDGSATAEGIMRLIEDDLEEIGCDYEVKIHRHHGKPFELEDENLKRSAKKALKQVTGSEPRLITEGGGSDGRFFAEKGIPFVEIGLNQDNVHKANESCSVSRIRELHKAYVKICRNTS